MKTIAIVSQKGGVGKTTTTAALGAGLHRTSQRILVVDIDPQANASTMLEATPGPTIYDVLTGRSKTAQAIQTTAQGSIIPSDARLAEKGVLTGKGAEYRLKSALEPVKKDFDACLIDCPPNLGALSIAALTAADGVIVPCRPDRFSLSALHEISATLEAVRKATNTGLTVYGVLLTQFNRRSTLHRLMLDELRQQAEAMGMTVLDPPIRATVAFDELQFTNSTIFDTRNGAAEDYQAITSTILKRLKGA